MTRIRHLSGPLSGEQSIPDDVDEIIFGRAKDCQMRFPEDAKIVGRRHFALVRKPSGDWHVDLFGDHYVEINGIPAQPYQRLPEDAEIRLGNKKGPSLQVITPPLPKEVGAKTDRQEPVEPTWIRLRRHARAGIAAFLVLVIAGLGWVFYDQWQKEETAGQLSELSERQAQVERGQAEIASASIHGEDRKRLIRAAFVVIAQDEKGRLDAEGTAWPVGPNLLATNAHVAGLRPPLLKNGGKMLVRAPGADGALFEVVEEKIHPGYTEFPAYVQSRDVVVETSGDLGASTPDLLPAYDVALLKIAGEVSPDAILQVASREELLKLEPGTPLASAGYPMEYIVGADMQTMGATPQLHFGTIGALTDYFILPTDDADQRHLIHHTIPATGGASGSAMMAPSGHVVALLNAGSNLPSEELGRIPNAALVNFGQRADVLTDLMEDKEEPALARDHAYWDKEIADFKIGSKVIIPAALSLLKPPSKGATLELISEEKGLLSEKERIEKPDRVWRIKGHKVTLEAGVPYVFLVYPEGAGAWLFYQGEDYSLKASNKNQIQCPTITYTPETKEVGYVAVQSLDQDIPYTLEIYAWKPPQS